MRFPLRSIRNKLLAVSGMGTLLLATVFIGYWMSYGMIANLAMGGVWPYSSPSFWPGDNLCGLEK